MTDKQRRENDVLVAVEYYGWHWILSLLASECERQADEDRSRMLPDIARELNMARAIAKEKP